MKGISGLMVVCWLALAVPVGAAEVGTLDLIVRETAGIRRFDYPVHATLTMPRAVTSADSFRLLADDKPVPAQFRLGEASGKGKTVALDFSVSVRPFEVREYRVEYGPKVKSSEPKSGLKIEETKEAAFLFSGGMSYTIPFTLKGLLHEVKGGKSVYLRPGSAGLKAHEGKKEHPLAGARRLRYTRHGPLAVALRYESSLSLSGGKKSGVVIDLVFPRSKSWVQVDVAIDDPDDRITHLSAELDLEVDPTPTLVDFGAGSMVYTTLRAKEAAAMSAGPGPNRWAVSRGKVGSLQPFVVSPDKGKVTPAEGWAHVMDRQRCTAIAVAQFGARLDRIAVEGSGKLTLVRDFAGVRPKERDPRKHWRFWLHFVSMPVQVGAVTSPQSMMAPLQVETVARK
jgi:hypothetical protein